MYRVLFWISNHGTNSASNQLVFKRDVERNLHDLFSACVLCIFRSHFKHLEVAMVALQWFRRILRYGCWAEDDAHYEKNIVTLRVAVASGFGSPALL